MRFTRTSLSGVIAAVLPLAAPMTASAQETLLLDEIVISGGLTPISAGDYGRAHTIVTAEEIAETQAVYAVEVLRSLPGVAVSRTGSFGGLTQVRLRGAEGNHTLVLIDGVQANLPEQGEFDFSGLLASDIARIEVLRGPQSALFGSNAIGGVISITTKRAEAEGISIESLVEVGSDGSVGAEFALRQSIDRLSYSFSAARRSTGGFDVADAPGGDKDGDENLTLNFGAEYRISDDLTLSGHLRHVDARSEFDQFNWGATSRDLLVTDADLGRDRQETFAGLALRWAPVDGRLHHELSTDYGLFHSQNRDTGARTSDTTSNRSELRYRATVGLDGAVSTAAHLLTVQLERGYETYKHNDPALASDPSQLDKQTRTRHSIAAEYRATLENDLNFQIGLRYDANDRFRDFVTWSAALSWQVPGAPVRLHASAGTGVQNPTMVEQFGWNPGTWQGNPDLEPEQSRGWDVGAEFTLANGVVDVTYFRDRLTNEIGTDWTLPVPMPINAAGSSPREGIEVSGRFDLTDRLGLNLDYTWLNARSPDGTREVRRPRHELGLSASYALSDATRFNLGVRHVSGLMDIDFTSASFGADLVRLSDYTVVDLAASHAINDRLVLVGRVNNLFDRSYEELDGYATQGRTVYVGLRTQW